jgi:hypothetical protein
VTILDDPLLAVIAVGGLLVFLAGFLRALRRYRYVRTPKMTMQFDYHGGGLVELVTPTPEAIRNVRVDGVPVDTVAIPGSGFVGVLMPDDGEHHVTFDVLTRS